MKKSIKQKALILAVICGLTLTTVNCGIILYPERKGQKSGDLDVPIIVLDCLWLIAGVVPGVVALVVDYATGGIYQSSAPVKAKPGKKASLHLNGPAPASATIEIRLSSKDGSSSTLLSQKFAKGETKRTRELIFSIPENLAPGTYKLAIYVNDIQNAEWPLQI